MHIAIDDTYGPISGINSKFVTTARRTHIAVIFDDDQAKEARDVVSNLLARSSKRLNKNIDELHFTDIYNRSGPWKDAGRYNLALIKYMMLIYRKAKWRVILQTIDDRTISDHPQITNIPSIEGLNPKARSDLSLILLLIKLRIELKNSMPPINLYVDGGTKSAGKEIGKEIFSKWKSPASGRFSDSKAEMLLQIADFLAFSINRSTHLLLKGKRTRLDERFLASVGHMCIDCDDLLLVGIQKGSDSAEFDAAHANDRARKGLRGA